MKLFEIANLDYTNLTIETREIVSFGLFEFSITPREYLKFAKQDLKDKKDKNLINSLSNAKRGYRFFRYNFNWRR